MLVEGKNLTTIWHDASDGFVKIIDQRLLPHELKIVNLNTLTEAVFAIKEMSDGIMLDKSVKFLFSNPFIP